MRNYCCAHYQSCLDEAARTGAPWDDCQGCPDRHNNDPAPITVMELAGIAALLAWVFYDVRIDPTDIVAADLVAPSAERPPWADFDPYRDMGRGEIVDRCAPGGYFSFKGIASLWQG